MRTRVMLIIAVLCIVSATALAQTTATPYKQPPADIVRMLDAPSLPSSDVSPDGRWLLLMERPDMPTIEDLAQPMLRLAGARISPRTNGSFSIRDVKRLTVIEISSKRSRDIILPPNPRLSSIDWSPDGRHLAFTQRLDNGIELWVADPSTGKSRRIAMSHLNATTGSPYQWLPDSSGFLCRLVPAGRGSEPKRSDVPSGPNVQETSGRQAPVRTYQDLLQDAHDAALFKYYFTSQLARIDLATGRATNIGSPEILSDVEVSPDGRFIIVERTVPPFSFFVPYRLFAQEVEVWDMKGKTVRKMASLPLAENIPIGGVRTGPRSVNWQTGAPATLIYVEALDEGNPRKKVAQRDRVLMLEAPFAGEARELFKSEFRFGGLQWTERAGLAFWRDFDRPSRKSRIYLHDFNQANAKSRLVFDLSTEDRYNDPGSFVSTTDKTGRRVVMLSKDGQHAYLNGRGSSPEGDHPFLRRFDLNTFKTEELFRSEDPYYESVDTVLDPEAQIIITARESTDEPPNLLLRDLNKKTHQALTNFTDPQPLFRKVKKEFVTYKRADGVTLSGTIYLPPDYKEGERRPTFIWAYPREFASADAAGQVTGSPNRFTRVGGASHLFLLLQGYVVLDNASMPVLGGDKANDTLIEQLVQNAKAAIDYLDQKGVTDRERVGVGGHSYGAFMTANLLAHSDLFRAGIARSGAYNRTLTPFSFQNEQRTYWEAPEVYTQVSPFMHADKINEPLLMIHGEADNNSGTFPIQSDRMFHALKGLGRTARLVTLPLESHGYAARESVLHTIHEMINWMDRYVKNGSAASESTNR